MSSLLPLLLELDAPRRPHQHVSLTLAPDELFGVINHTRDYYRPWHQLSKMLLDSSSTIKAEKNKFQINLDVQHFAPEEITVKTCDGFVVVEGKHEEKRDEHGWVSRQFRRRYELPTGCSAESVQSRLSSDGVLTVTAPLPTQAPDERVVPIVHTGPVRTQTQPESAWGLLGDGEAPAVLKTPIENGQ